MEAKKFQEEKAQKIKKSLKKIETKQKKDVPNVGKKAVKKNPLTTKKKMILLD